MVNCFAKRQLMHKCNRLFSANKQHKKDVFHDMHKCSVNNAKAVSSSLNFKKRSNLSSIKLLVLLQQRRIQNPVKHLRWSALRK